LSYWCFSLPLISMLMGPTTVFVAIVKFHP
jgi:hypothetical protein